MFWWPPLEGASQPKSSALSRSNGGQSELPGWSDHGRCATTHVVGSSQRTPRRPLHCYTNSVNSLRDFWLTNHETLEDTKTSRSPARPPRIRQSVTETMVVESIIYYITLKASYTTAKTLYPVYTRSYTIAKSTARPSCVVGVLYDISWERTCWWLINHFT